jgi:hypothetical protein
MDHVRQLVAELVSDRTPLDSPMIARNAGDNFQIDGYTAVSVQIVSLLTAGSSRPSKMEYRYAAAFNGSMILLDPLHGSVQSIAAVGVRRHLRDSHVGH